jgi:hypothetical protein
MQMRPRIRFKDFNFFTKELPSCLKVKKRFRAIGSTDIGIDQALPFSFIINTIGRKMPLMIISV